MTQATTHAQVVYTNKAHCRDCYRCLRVCPVKAIKMENGQAFVVAERCIACGTCIRECPQGAKQYRHDVERASRLLAESPRVAVSVAPSFAAAYPGELHSRFVGALRRLGFAYIAETAVGAWLVAQETARLCNSQPDRSHICTACPAVVNYVEIYARDLLPQMVPVASPMIAHARQLKQRMGADTPVVFIGPCVAKKAEADRPQYTGLVDCALTFEELNEWLEREQINIADCAPDTFDESPAGEARLFPLAGGSIRTASLDSDLLSADMVSASGFDEVREALANTGRDAPPQVIEPLFCDQGCVNGPAIAADGSLYRRRREVIDYAHAHPGETAAYTPDPLTVRTEYAARHVPERTISEEQIHRMLERSGKGSPEDQLNCGACGYASCRDKAIAVIKGMAEPEMCIPHMKRLAEQRTDRIIETSPNGIFILDQHLRVIHMNPAFRRFFGCSEAMLGHPVSEIMDPEPFMRLTSGEVDSITMVARHEKYGMVCHQILYALPDDEQYAGIFVDITNNRENKEKLDQLREQTVAQARELLDHQVRMAQTIARFLGESAGQGEALLDRLMELASGENGDQMDEGAWSRDTSM